MSFLIPPATASQSDVSAHLAHGCVMGLMARAATRTRYSRTDADKSVSHYRNELDRCAQHLISEAQAQYPNDPAKIQAMAMAGGAALAGLVSRGEHIDDAAISLARSRTPLLRACASLSSAQGLETSLPLFCGVLQGAVGAGASIETATTQASRHKRALEAAGHSMSQQENPADRRCVSVACSLYGTALAGLVARGEQIDQALSSTRAHRPRMWHSAVQALSQEQPAPAGMSDALSHRRGTQGPSLPRDLSIN